MKKRLRKPCAAVLFFLGTLLSTHAQNRIVNGRVVSEKNEPLTGASVVVKNNPSTGTTTSSSGTFTLNIGATADSLLVTAVGYAAQTVAISEDVQVRLLSASSQMEEVVVIGY